MFELITTSSLANIFYFYIGSYSLHMDDQIYLNLSNRGGFIDLHQLQFSFDLNLPANANPAPIVQREGSLVNINLNSVIEAHNAKKKYTQRGRALNNGRKQD